jgi:hypothetical protein
MRLRLEFGQYPLLRVFCKAAGECAYFALRFAGPMLTVESPSDWHEDRRLWVRFSPVMLVLLGVVIARNPWWVVLLCLPLTPLGVAAISLPWWGKVPADDGQCSGPTYGFAFHSDKFWVYTGKSTSGRHAWIATALPWSYAHVRHSYLNPDGSLHHDAEPQEYTAPAQTKTRYPYVYVRANGEVQNRRATVNGEERECRLHYAPWLPWPRKVFRSINVEFSDEVGEQSGSWKGGTIGCGWEWRLHETQEEALYRMQRERRF